MLSTSFDKFPRKLRGKKSYFTWKSLCCNLGISRVLHIQTEAFYSVSMHFIMLHLNMGAQEKGQKWIGQGEHEVRVQNCFEIPKG